MLPSALALLELVILVVSLMGDPVNGQFADNRSNSLAGPRLTLPVLLGRLGKRCDCVFTIEEAWTDGESVGPNGRHFYS